MNSARLVAGFLVLAALGAALPAEPTATKSPKQALQALNDLIGEWRGTGTPSGDRQRRDFWTEKLTWAWQFKGKDAWLTVAFDKSKHFDRGELRYVPAEDSFSFTVRTPDKESLTFTGPLKNRVLTLERKDEGRKETQRVVLTLLHENRFLYRYEVKPQARPLFSKLYQVGATKEGVPFAAGDGRPECIVSGGVGTLPVSYKGQTYYVCCSGCRAEFNEDPEKYVKEYQQKKAKAKER
jgi:YHS domain